MTRLTSGEREEGAEGEQRRGTQGQAGSVRTASTVAVFTIKTSSSAKYDGISIAAIGANQSAAESKLHSVSISAFLPSKPWRTAQVDRLA